MLAGYLPFDDDPANPEGDNINLLYKYIVSTPLTFPEYVTPHARDLLKRILVPDPRKRADLFEVARHSWLADYSHVVGFITSSNTNANEAQQASVYSSMQPKVPYGPTTNKCVEDTFEQQPPLARSASVREPGKPHTAATQAHGGLTAKREQINQPPSEKPKTTRDNKRRTVQVEYVAPQSQTTRGEASPPAQSSAAPHTDGYQSASTKQATARPRQEAQRSVSDYTAFGNAPPAAVRPSTGGTLGGGSRLPSRGNSYGQPSAAAVAQTNAEGRFSQPKGKQYSISAPFAQPESTIPGEQSIGQPSTQRVQSIQLGPSGGAHSKGGHKRSNTVTETLGRMTSMFSGRQQSYSHDPKGSMTSQNSYAQHPEEKRHKNYPPTSMAGPMSNDAIAAPRHSTESSRRTSFGFSRKNTNNSGDVSRPSRRFSLLPSSLSKTFSSQRESLPPSAHGERRGSSARPRAGSRPGMAFGRGDSRSPSQSTQGSNMPGFYDGQHDSNSRIRHPTSAPGPSSAPPNQTHFQQDYPATAPIGDEKFPNPRDPHPSMQNRPYRQHTIESEDGEGPSSSHQPNPYPMGMGGEETQQQQQQRKGVLQKHRKFADAYEGEGSNKGSSGSSKRVMDFFRRMGRQRGER